MIGDKHKIFNFQFSIFKSRKGFTLVELIVAMAVFSTVIIVVSSIFVSVVGSQRKNINNQDVIDNARFVLENIARAVRQGEIITPTGTVVSSCSTADPCLKISHPIKGEINYSLSNGQIMEKSSADADPVALSSSNVFVEELDFTVAGVGADQEQPRVTISIALRSATQPAGVDTTTNLQTTITPRNLEIQLIEPR